MTVVGEEQYPPMKKPSIGAGPRRFVAASQALRACGNSKRPALHRRVTAIRTTSPVRQDGRVEDAEPGASPCLGDTALLMRDPEAVCKREKGSLISPSTTSIPDPNVLQHASIAAQRVMQITRKPVGSSPRLDSRVKDASSPQQPFPLPNSTVCTPPGSGRLEEVLAPRVSAHGYRPSSYLLAESVEDKKTDFRDLINQHATRSPTSTDEPSGFARQVLRLLALLIPSIEYVLKMCGSHFNVGQILALWPALGVMLSSEAPADQRLRAMKVVVPGLGQAFAVFTLLAVIWKTAAALKELIDIVLWPLTVARGFARFVFG